MAGLGLWEVHGGASGLGAGAIGDLGTFLRGMFGGGRECGRRPMGMGRGHRGPCGRVSGLGGGLWGWCRGGRGWDICRGGGLWGALGGVWEGLGCPCGLSGGWESLKGVRGWEVGGIYEGGHWGWRAMGRVHSVGGNGGLVGGFKAGRGWGFLWGQGICVGSVGGFCGGLRAGRVWGIYGDGRLVRVVSGVCAPALTPSHGQWWGVGHHGRHGAPAR